MPKGANMETMKIPLENDASGITERGTPRARIQSVHSAWTLFQHLVEDCGEQAFRRAMVQGLVDGRAPVSPEKMTRMGLGNEPNVNWREAESIIRQKTATLWSMFVDMPTIASFQLKDPNAERIVAGRVATKLETLTTSMIRDEWPDFHYVIMLRNQQLMIHGLGTTYWPDPRDWRSRTALATSVLLPPTTRCQPSAIEKIILLDAMPCSDLFDIIEGGDIEGWNKNQIRKAMVRALSEKKENLSELTEYERMARLIRAGSADAPPIDVTSIPIAHLLIKETDSGMISHYVFPSQQEPTEKDDFLYQRQDLYPDMSRAVNIAFYDIADGYVRGVRGLGWKIFPFCETSNTFLNRVISGANLSAGLIVQPENEQAASKVMEIKRRGPITSIPPNLRTIQNTFAPPLEALIQVRSMMQQVLNFNDGVFHVGREPWQTAERSATEISTVQQHEARFEAHTTAWYYVAWNTWLQETVRRLFEDPEFKARARQLMVPEEWIRYEAWHVSAIKAIGMGSAQLRQAYTREAIQLAPYLDTEGTRNVLADFISARFGHEYTDRYLPEDESVETRIGFSTAMMENAHFKNGDIIPVADGHDDIAHLAGHLPAFQKIAEKIQNGEAGTEEDLKLLVIGLQHCTVHLQRMVRNPATQGVAKQIARTLSSFGPVIDRIEQTLVQQAKMAAQQQKAQMELLMKQAQMDPELELKRKGMENELQVRLAREARLGEIAQAKLMNRTELDRIRLQLEDQRERERDRMELEQEL